MSAIASQITSLTIVYSIVYSRCRPKKTSKLRVTGLCAGNSPGPVNSPHKGPVTRKRFPFDDVITILFMHFSCVGWMDRFLIWTSHGVKDTAHFSTFKFFILDKSSCFIVLVVFFIAQSPESISVWFREQMAFSPTFISHHVFAIYGQGFLRAAGRLQLVALVCHRSTVWS